MDVKEFAEIYCCDEVLVKSAFDNLANGAFMMAFSGKMCSGKDEISLTVINKLNKEFNYVSFAKGVKDEVDGIIKILKENNLQAATELIQRATGSENSARTMAQLLLSDEDFSSDTYNARCRTIPMRKALQYWGTEVRRAQDQNYWVKNAMTESVKLLADGKNVTIVDCRFPNELQALRDIRATTVYLSVPENVRISRLLQRDGIKPAPETLNHISEISLDTTPPEAYSLYIDNHSNTAEQTAQTVLEYIKGAL